MVALLGRPVDEAKASRSAGEQGKRREFCPVTISKGKTLRLIVPLFCHGASSGPVELGP